MGQAVSHRPLTKKSRDQSQARKCGISGGRSGNGTGISQSTSVFQSNITPPIGHIHPPINIMYSQHLRASFNIPSAGQETACTLWNPNACYHAPKSVTGYHADPHESRPQTFALQSYFSNRSI